MTEMPEVWSQPAIRNLTPIYPSIEISKIIPSRYQARKRFDEDQIQALAESIRQEGLIEPIIVRAIDDHYELVSGERRLRACKFLGYVAIEAKVIQTISDAETAAKGLIENLQREDLSPVEEAEGFRDLIGLKDSHWTQRRLAEVVGKSEGYISQSLSLLGLPSEVLQNFRALKFSRSHGLELLRLPAPEKQIDALKHVLNNKLSWEATRKLVDHMLGKATSERRTKNSENKAPVSELKVPSSELPADPLADLWPIVMLVSGLKGVEYRGNLTWRLDVMPGRADLDQPDPIILKKELQTHLAEALIAAGQMLKQTS